MNKKMRVRKIGKIWMIVDELNEDTRTRRLSEFRIMVSKLLVSIVMLLIIDEF